jgi:alpha-L-fucosidase 2
MKAARQSLIYRGDEATGWSIGWKTNCWARFRDGDHAMELLKLLFTPAGTKAGSYPNLFDAHPPFQIDGNFGGAAGIAEMLVQSHAGYIDLLPALPSVWNKLGSVKGVRVRGGLILDFKWSNGSITELIVHATTGGKALFKIGGKMMYMDFKKGTRKSLLMSKQN